MVDGVGGPGEVRRIEGIQNPFVEKSKGKERKEKEDQVEIKHASLVSDLIEEAKKIPSVREELVEDLRKAIESGNYFVDVEKLARKLLEELSE